MEQLKLFDPGKSSGHLGKVREACVVSLDRPRSVFDSSAPCLDYVDKNTH